MTDYGLRVLLAIVLASCLCLPACRPASFYYRLEVLNSTDSDFIKVTLIQLTDIMKRGPGNPAVTRIVARGKTEQLIIAGDCDSESTLFLLVAHGCGRDGRQETIPLERALVKVLPFSEFRSNTFSPLEKVVFEINDEDLKSVLEVGIMAEFNS